MNCHPIASHAYKVERCYACQVPSLHTLAFQSFTLPFIARCTAPTPRTMANEIDPTLSVIGEVLVDEAKTIFGVESDTLVASSSSNAAAEKMSNKTIPEFTDY
jgi:hypothetical protein